MEKTPQVNTNAVHVTQDDSCVEGALSQAGLASQSPQSNRFCLILPVNQFKISGHSLKLRHGAAGVNPFSSLRPARTGL